MGAVIEEQICKCCGQSLPSEYDLKLPVGYQVLFNYIRKAGKHGIRSNRLYNQVYSGVRNGGPNYKTLAARIYWLNRHLKKHGLKVKGECTGSHEHGRYRVHVV